MSKTKIWLVVLTVLVALSACDVSKNAALQKVSEGLQYSNQNDYRRAISSFEEAIGINSTVAEAHYYIGLLRLQQYHDANAAVNSLERALEFEPQDPNLKTQMFYQYGVALEELDRPQQAMPQYQEAVTLNSNHGEALFRMGRIVESDGEIRDAIDYYTRSIYANPRFPFSYNALGNIYLRYGEQEAALEVFENGIQNNPDDTQNRSNIARVYIDRGSIQDLGSAISHLTVVAEQSSPSLAVQFNLGVAYRERFLRSNSQIDHDAAVEWITFAQQRCNPNEEQVLCDSIAAALIELAPSIDVP